MSVLFEAKKDFLDFFGYPPNEPNEIFFDENKYIDVLERSVKDKFDYTIELYGTNPEYGTKKHSGIFID